MSTIVDISSTSSSSNVQRAFNKHCITTFTLLSFLVFFLVWGIHDTSEEISTSGQDNKSLWALLLAAELIALFGLLSFTVHYAVSFYRQYRLAEAQRMLPVRRASSSMNSFFDE
jgi:cyanate permease